MKKRRENGDYAAISARHKEIVQRLCDPDAGASDWEAFFAEIRAYVTVHFTKRLKDEAGIEVEDFIHGELMEYFAAEKCEKFRQFLNLKGETHHFGSIWFTSQLRAAIDRAIEKSRSKIETISLRRQGDDGEEMDGLKEIKQSDGLIPAESKDSGSAVTLALERGGGELFTRILSKMWQRSPHECYAVVMDWWLKFDHLKIANFLGYRDHSPVAGNIRNFKRNLVKMGSLAVQSVEEQDRNEIQGLFRADGVCEKKEICDIASSRSLMEFEGRTSDMRRKFTLKVRFPFLAEKDTLIRCSICDGEGNIPNGRLVFCGKERSFRASGDFEISCAEFSQGARNSEISFEWDDGVCAKALPVVSGDEERYELTGDKIRKWISRKVTVANRVEYAAEMMNDFGPVLAFLLANECAFGADVFKRFGFPDMPKPLLERAANEAWILFKGDINVDENSPINPNGFMLPVEWIKTCHNNVTRYGELPDNLRALAQQVCVSLGVDGWQIVPSRQFFAERVNLNSKEVFGFDMASVSSASLALSVALEYAKNRFAYPRWNYSSIAWDFANSLPQPVGGLREKVMVVKSYGADELFVSPGQKKDKCDVSVRLKEVQARTLPGATHEIAYSHLEVLRPEELAEFHLPMDDEYLEKRRKLIANIRAKANPDKATSKMRFVTLFGKPGMGKSVLAGLLFAEMKKWGWIVLPYICRASKERQGIEFIKSLAYALTVSFGELYDLAAEDIGEIKVDDVNSLVAAFKRFVIAPLEKINGLYRGRKFVILVDGLDEDRSGMILDVLGKVHKFLPKGVSVVVSSRRIPQDELRLTALSSDVIDLNGEDKEINEGCYTDLRAYIDLWLLRDARVSKALFDAKISREDAKSAICEKDPSFIYAYHVLNGVAEGRYSFDRLKEQLPSDLCAAFYDAFRARFRTAEEYKSVKGLLAVLCRDGNVNVSEAMSAFCGDDENIGKVIRSLHGYVTVEGDHIRLSSEPLREWLTDCVNNPEFAVGKVLKNVCHIGVGQSFMEV